MILHSRWLPWVASSLCITLMCCGPDLSDPNTDDLDSDVDVGHATQALSSDTHTYDGDLNNDVLPFIANWASQGYRIDWISITTMQTASVVMRNNSLGSDTRGWVYYSNLTSAQLKTKLTSLPAGMRPVQIEIYEGYGDDIRYFLVAQEVPGSWSASWGMDAAQQQANFDAMKATMRPVSLSSMQFVGQGANPPVYYAALWDNTSVGAWEMWSDLSASAYATKFNNAVAAGRHLSYLSVHQVFTGAPRFSAIFNKSPVGSWKSLSGNRYPGCDPNFLFEPFCSGFPIGRMSIAYHDTSFKKIYAGLWTTQ